jgi:hypothetical protein
MSTIINGMGRVGIRVAAPTPTPTYPTSLKLFIDAGNPASYPGSGTTVTDLIGTQNGTLVNGVGYSSSNGGYFTFDGVNDYIDLTNNTTIRPTAARTIEGWFYINSGVGMLYSDGNLNANRDTVSFWQDSSNFYTVLGNGSTAQTKTSTKLNNATWVFVSLRFNGTTVELYFNNVLQYSIAQTVIPTNTSIIPAKIGTYNSTGYFLNGRCSMLKIFNEYRSTGDMTTDFNEFKSRYGY